MKIGLYVTAMLLGALGAACFIFAPHYSISKLFGMMLVALSAYFFSLIGKQRLSVGGELKSDTLISSSISKKLDILTRLLGLVAAFAMVASYLFLRSDALDGGHQIWPAYAFVVSVLFGAIVWSYLFARSISRRKGGGRN